MVQEKNEVKHHLFILSLTLSFSKELFPFIIKEIKIRPKGKEKFAMHSNFQLHTEFDCTGNCVLIKYMLSIFTLLSEKTLQSLIT